MPIHYANGELGSERDMYFSFSAERLNLFLQHPENEPIAENVEVNNVTTGRHYTTSVESPAKREPISRKEKWLQVIINAFICFPL